MIETERLTLRRLDPTTDAPFILDLLTDPTFIRGIADRGVRTEEEAGAYLEEWAVASYEEHGFGPLRVALRETDDPVGICGLFQRDHLDRPDLGFAVLERYQGNGYAHEAAEAVMTHARDDLGLSTLLAITSPDNTASARLLRRLGFVEMPDAPGSESLYGHFP